jgi:hypothetical protein
MASSATFQYLWRETVLPPAALAFLATSLWQGLAVTGLHVAARAVLKRLLLFRSTKSVIKMQWISHSLSLSLSLSLSRACARTHTHTHHWKCGGGGNNSAYVEIKNTQILRDFGDFPASQSADYGHNLSVMHEDTDKRLGGIHLACYDLAQDVRSTRCNRLTKSKVHLQYSMVSTQTVWRDLLPCYVHASYCIMLNVSLADTGSCLVLFIFWRLHPVAFRY